MGHIHSVQFCTCDIPHISGDSASTSACKQQPWGMMLNTMKASNLLVFTLLVTSAYAQSNVTQKEVESVYPDSHAFYLDLHQNPELVP